MAFKREVELLVGKKNNEAIKITKLKIDFEVHKTLSTNSSNNSIIKVYNCNEETNKSLCTANNHIILKVGYKDEIVTSILFGDIVKGSRKKEGVNVITEIEVAEGRTQIMTSNVSVSFGKNTTVKTVVKNYLDVLGFPVKGSENIPSGEKYEHGYSFIGMAIDGLKQVLNRVGLTYSIQNETLFIKKPNESIDNLGLNLTPQTGLLTLPTHISDKTNTGTIEEKTSNKWQFTTLLFPQLVPGAVCKVETPVLTSSIIIQEVKFKGSNFGNDFICDIIGVEK